MRAFFLGLILIYLPLSGYAEASRCSDIFTGRVVVRGRPRLTDQTINKIFITQEGIGQHYAKVKMAEKTGVPLDHILQLGPKTELKKSELEKIRQYAEESIAEEVFPAVLSPEGKVYIVDGHHNLYMAVLAGMDLNTSHVKLRIVRDYTNKTMEFFVEDLVTQHLVYDKSKTLLTRPKTIVEVEDNIERSLMGLAFLRIADEYEIPFKGTNFVPFVQFYLGDLITSKKLFVFNEDYSHDNIKALSKVIINHPVLLKFLSDSLAKGASPKVIAFLKERQELLRQESQNDSSAGDKK